MVLSYMDLAMPTVYRENIWLIKFIDGWRPVINPIQELLEYWVPKSTHEITLDWTIKPDTYVQFVVLYDTQNVSVKILKRGLNKCVKNEKNWKLLGYLQDNIPLQSCSSETQKNIYTFMMKNDYINTKYYKYHYYLIYQQKWYILRSLCIVNDPRL
jgi:hypothetical protein